MLNFQTISTIVGIFTSNTAGLAMTSGVLDDVAIFSRALSLAEVQTLFNATATARTAFFLSKL